MCSPVQCLADSNTSREAPKPYEEYAVRNKDSQYKEMMKIIMISIAVVGLVVLPKLTFRQFSAN